MKTVLVYTDGACSGNPGPGGWAALLVYQGHERELTGSEPETTNNRMELTAAIEGLRALNEPCDVALYSDSQYLVKAFQDRWIESWVRKGWKNSKREPVSNRDLWEALVREVARHQVEWLWVEGHSGDAFNERCDMLAVAACQTERGREPPPTPERPPRRKMAPPPSSWQEFERKRLSEEARLVRCPECGYSDGRHGRTCSRRWFHRGHGRRPARESREATSCRQSNL